MIVTGWKRRCMKSALRISLRDVELLSIRESYDPVFQITKITLNELGIDAFCAHHSKLCESIPLEMS